MPDPTDLDALMQAYRDLDDEKFHDTIEALRARLAPTTHADDEALVGAHDAALYDLHDLPEWGSDETRSKRQAVVDAAANAILSRLSELRARAEAAERALAECRDKTIEDACAALKAKQAMLIDVGCDGPVVNAFSSAMGVIRALKKEPRDA